MCTVLLPILKNIKIIVWRAHFLFKSLEILHAGHVTYLKLEPCANNCKQPHFSNYPHHKPSLL